LMGAKHCGSPITCSGRQLAYVGTIAGQLSAKDAHHQHILTWIHIVLIFLFMPGLCPLILGAGRCTTPRVAVTARPGSAWWTAPMTGYLWGTCLGGA
jgi:hypothetical protein